jgi:hypothetical protein
MTNRCPRLIYRLGTRNFLCLQLIALYIYTVPGVSVTPVVDCYRIGDVVDTEATIDGRKRLNPLRHLMPKFGTQWEKSVRFEKSNISGLRSNESIDDAITFSLKFEDGMWELPTLSLIKEYHGQQPKFLDSVTVRFVISTSGVGTIHAVVAKDIAYITEHKPYFRVKYEWIEEGAASPSAGHTVMFLLVFIFSIFVLLMSCGVMTSTGDSKPTYVSHGYNSDEQFSVPKWD